MKKVLATILALVMALSVTTAAWAETTGNCAGGESCNHQAAIGNTHYDTLIAAVAAVADGGEVTLLRDCMGAGVGTFKTPAAGQIQAKSFTIDFAGKTYTIGDPAVGSTNYETQGFHLEWSGDAANNHTVVFKNGTIAADENTSQVKMLVQNYCNLELYNMVLDGENLVASDVGYYTLSNCCGTITVEDTMIVAHENGVAFDVDGGRSQYGNAPVVLTVSGDSVIDGRFEVSDQNNRGNTLTVSGGTFSDGSAVNYLAEGVAFASLTDETAFIAGEGNINAAAQAGNDVTVLAGNVAFTNVPSGTVITNNGGGDVTVNGSGRVTEGNPYTVPQPPRYYYNSTTTTTTGTKADGTKGSPKTFDAGVGIYAVSAILSVTGMAYVGKRKF